MSKSYYTGDGFGVGALVVGALCFLLLFGFATINAHHTPNTNNPVPYRYSPEEVLELGKTYVVTYIAINEHSQCYITVEDANKESYITYLNETLRVQDLKVGDKIMRASTGVAKVP